MNLGSTEVIDSSASFGSESTSPAAPGSKTISRGLAIRRPNGRDDLDALASAIDDNFSSAVQDARAQVEMVRSSTTLATLSHALESAGEVANAVDAAREALSLCASQTASPNADFEDQLSARLAIQVLIRAGEVESAYQSANTLPFNSRMKVVFGAMFAGLGRLAEAHALIDDADAPGLSAVRGFILLGEGKTQQAISQLRAALRESPDDADSALNLSIAFWRIGAMAKSVSLALQATRSAPGRQDISIHYLELLLQQKDYQRFDQEVAKLAATGIAHPSRLLVLEARAYLSRGNAVTGLKLLAEASATAVKEGDLATQIEVDSNIIRIRAAEGKMSRDVAISQLIELHDAHATNEIIVINLAQVADRRSHAEALSRAFTAIRDKSKDPRMALIQYQLATLTGDNSEASKYALEWLQFDPDNPHALWGAMVALGIGEERWQEASDIAHHALEVLPDDGLSLNNAGYVLAMAGMAEEAIALLTPHVNSNFVVRATLGLAYLSLGDVSMGMRLYREAAIEAEGTSNDSRSLMTGFQALVVRQLGLLEKTDDTLISALSLPPVDLPDDWDDKPEFLRLHTIAINKGFTWPLSL